MAYLAVQRGDTALMAQTVAQCGLQRDVLKANDQNWRHIIGPESQDTGLWATGNGWAGYGMVRVLYTLQKWQGSSSMSSVGLGGAQNSYFTVPDNLETCLTSSRTPLTQAIADPRFLQQANQLKGWIKEILDGALSSSTSGGLLRNYLNDGSWFGEISGTALLSAVAYRMAVNDPGMFPQKYINWADNNRETIAQHQNGGREGIFSPTVDPYSWLDQTPYTNGSPEGQAFTIYLYTAYRDCVDAGLCAASNATITIAVPGIGPSETLTNLHAPVTFNPGSAPTGVSCGAAQCCDANGCSGSFNGLAAFAVCTAGDLKGCQCTATETTCGSHQSCDLNGCAGEFDGLTAYAQCKGNFIGCEVRLSIIYGVLRRQLRTLVPP